MDEACPLKSRFLVSSRIPFIYGYIDPDIPLDSAVSLRVANDESLIPWSVVEDFLSRISSSPYDAEWSALQHCMSVTEKTRLLANFVEEIHLDTNKES